jgi:hypothetical protein
MRIFLAVLRTSQIGTPKYILCINCRSAHGMKRNNREQRSQRCAGLRMQICQTLCPARGMNEPACAQPQATADDPVGAPFRSCNQQTVAGDQCTIPTRSAQRVLALVRHVEDVTVVDRGGRMQLQASTARPLLHTLPNSAIPEVPRNYCTEMCRTWKLCNW